MAGFDEAAAHSLQIEGGFTDDPNDKGNWTGNQIGVGELKGTNFGISAGAYPDIDIKQLTRERALQLYRRDYWDAIRAGELPYAIALVVFDAAVNCGVMTAVRLLQETLNIAADGKIGPITIGAAQRARDPFRIIAVFSRRRVLYHTRLPTFSRYGASWVQRTLDTAIAATRAVAPSPTGVSHG